MDEPPSWKSNARKYIKKKETKKRNKMSTLVFVVIVANCLILRPLVHGDHTKHLIYKFLGKVIACSIAVFRTPRFKDGASCGIFSQNFASVKYRRVSDHLIFL